MKARQHTAGALSEGGIRTNIKLPRIWVKPIVKTYFTFVDSDPVFGRFEVAGWELCVDQVFHKLRPYFEYRKGATTAAAFSKQTALAGPVSARSTGTFVKKPRKAKK